MIVLHACFVRLTQPKKMNNDRDKTFWVVLSASRIFVLPLTTSCIDDFHFSCLIKISTVFVLYFFEFASISIKPYTLFITNCVMSIFVNTAKVWKRLSCKKVGIEFTGSQRDPNFLPSIPQPTTLAF